MTNDPVANGETPGSDRDYTVRALDRACDMFDLLIENPDGLTTTNISADTPGVTAANLDLLDLRNGGERFPFEDLYWEPRAHVGARFQTRDVVR